MSKNDRRKSPKIAPGNAPFIERQPRTEPASTQEKNPAWSFNLIDFDGPWCPKIMDRERFLYVLEKLCEFESMTWREIEGSRSHSIEVWMLCKQARDRLLVIRQDDIAELFSLRLSGRERVWGIRDGHIFRFLWWDPEHKVYPVQKKHT